MTESDLEQLIAEWYQRPGPEQQRLTSSSDCPPLTRLWSHVADGQPLDEYEGHVEGCERCIRLREIMEHEHDQATIAAGAGGQGAPFLAKRGVADRHRERGPGRSYRPIYAAASLLAAACITLLVIPRPAPVPSLQSGFEEFITWAHGEGSATRGGDDESTSGRSGQQTRQSPPAWVEATLNTPGVSEALDRRRLKEQTFISELGEGRLRLDADGRLVLADAIDRESNHGKTLLRELEEDRAAGRTIAEALARHIPGASPEDADAIARSLDRWRAKHVFGGG